MIVYGCMDYCNVFLVIFELLGLFVFIYNRFNKIKFIIYFRVYFLMEGFGVEESGIVFILLLCSLVVKCDY